MINKRVPHTSDEEWHQIILATRSSGLSDFEYCRNNNILSNTVYRALTPPYHCSYKYSTFDDEIVFTL